MSGLEPGRRGRRVAERSSSRPDRSAIAAVALLALVALAVLLTRPPAVEQATTTPAAGLVQRTELVCPAPAPGSAGEAVAGVAALPGLEAAGTFATGRPGATRAEAVPARGSLVRLDGGTVAVGATGPAAAGLFATRADRTSRARAVGHCAGPRPSWWFVGAGGALDHRSVLQLTNTDPGPAVVDVRVLAAEGELDTVSTRGLALAPGETRELALTDLAPGRSGLVVNVQASRGRVAAAVSDRWDRGAAQGRAWLPAATAPARLVRLAGVPADGSGRTVLVGNPSDAQAIVDLQLSGAGGTFTPVGARTVVVPAGSVEEVDVSEVVPPGEPVSVVLRAQVPLVATLRTVSGSDHAYSAAARWLGGPGVAPTTPGGQLQLTAGGTGAVAVVQPFTRDGEPLPEERVRLQPGTTVGQPVPRSAASVLVTPAQGRLLGAVVVDDRAGVAVAPVLELPFRVQVPRVVPGPR